MTLLSAFHYLRQRARVAHRYLRGKYILGRYTAHYRTARRVYRAGGDVSARELGVPRTLGVRVFEPGTPAPLVLDPDYDALVAKVARGAAAALERTANCRFYPPLPLTILPERTADVPAVVRGDVISIQLQDPFGIDGLRELCDPLLAQLERQLFKAYTIADRVYVYRSPISTQTPGRSWLWHFDNHPREMMKVMVYLTDVTDDSAPFEYVCERASGRPLYGSPIAPLHGLSRVDGDAIERRLATGWARQRVIGARGTIVLFDDNVVHRATLARAAHRDVVVFQVRPATFQSTPRIDPRWTGSFGHASINRDPGDLKPLPRV